MKLVCADNPDAKYSVSQVCALTGRCPSALRHWENLLGELMTPARLAGGARRYTESDVRTIQELIQLKREGYTNASAKQEMVRRRTKKDEIDTVEQAMREIQLATQAIARESARIDDAMEFLARHAATKK